MNKVLSLVVAGVLFSGCMGSSPKPMSVEDLRAIYGAGTKVVTSPSGKKLYLEEFFKLSETEQVIKAKKFKSEMIRDSIASFGGVSKKGDTTAMSSERLTQSARNVLLESMPPFMQNQIRGKKEEVVNKEKLQLSTETLIGIKKIETKLFTSIKNQHNVSIVKVAISSDERLFATVDSRATVHVFDLKEGKLLKSFVADDEGVIYLKFIDAQRLLTATSKSAKLWNIESGEELKVFNELSLEREMRLDKKKKEKQEHNEALYHYSKQSKKRQAQIDAISGFGSGLTRSIREEYDTVIENYINTLTLTADKSKVLISKSLGDIHVWDIEKGKVVKVLEDKNMAYGLAFIGNNRCVATTKQGFLVRDINSGKEIMLIKGRGMRSKVYSNKEYFVTYNKEHHFIRLFDNMTLKELGKITVPKELKKIVFSNKGVVLGDSQGKIYLWDFKHKSALSTVATYPQPIKDLLFVSSEQKLISSTSSSIEAWQF